MFAAWFNNPGIVSFLIESGADINAIDDYGMNSIMRAAAFNRDYEVLRILLEAGADVSVEDIFGQNVLDYAIIGEIPEDLYNLLREKTQYSSQLSTG